MIFKLASLLPQDLYIARPALLLAAMGAAGLYLLARGADWMVSGASGTALRLGMPPILIGATIVSLGTTSPEAAVSVLAAWNGEPDLALGNATGSIIANTALIFGLGCCLAPIPANRFVLTHQGRVQIGSGFLLAALCYSLWAWKGSQAALTRPVGLLLLGLLGLYLHLSVRWGQHQAGPASEETGKATEAAGREPAWFLAGRLIGGLVLVVLCSELVTGCVAELARQWGIPMVVIAATIVSIGTSLPELVVGLASVRRGQPQLLLGNVIGADILNVLFVVGASAAAADLPIVDPAAPRPEIYLLLHLPTLLIALTLFHLFLMRAAHRGHFARWQGIPLLGLYATYLFLNYWLTR